MLKLRPCENEGELKARGEAELKVLPLKAGELKVLLWATCGDPKLLPDGRLTRPLKVPEFRPPDIGSLLIEVAGVVLAILEAVDAGAEAIRFWLSPTIVRALDWTLGDLKIC